MILGFQVASKLEVTEIWYFFKVRELSENNENCWKTKIKKSWSKGKIMEFCSSMMLATLGWKLACTAKPGTDKSQTLWLMISVFKPFWPCNSTWLHVYVSRLQRVSCSIPWCCTVSGAARRSLGLQSPAHPWVHCLSTCSLPCWNSPVMWNWSVFLHNFSKLYKQ